MAVVIAVSWDQNCLRSQVQVRPRVSAAASNRNASKNPTEVILIDLNKTRQVSCQHFFACSEGIEIKAARYVASSLGTISGKLVAVAGIPVEMMGALHYIIPSFILNPDLELLSAQFFEGV